MRRLLAVIGAVLASVTPAAATAPPIAPAVVHQVDRLKTAHGIPLYYLGLRWHGLTLVKVESSTPADLYYADCTADEASVMAPACHHLIDLELGPPIPGEISTQGRCTFATTIRGVTAALFPVNANTLRVFTRRTTIEISAVSRADMLGAARALRGLNIRLAAGAPFPPRNVSRQLGSCRPARVRPQLPLTLKQTYERRMKGTFTAASASTLNLSNLNTQVANPPAVVRSFLRNARTFPLLLRTEAERLALIPPPQAVAALHARLIRALRTYATDVDDALRVVRAGAWRDNATWPATSKRLQLRLDRDATEVATAVRAFSKRGYTIVVGSR
jgi:hypothetical protein